MQKPAAVAPIRISAAVREMVVKEAAVAGRTLGGQVDYWTRLGRAVEASPAFNRERVQAALEGRFDAGQLTAEEAEVYYPQESEAMEKYETPEGRAFLARLRAKGGGSGVDEQGRLVRGRPDGSFEVLKESIDE